MDLRWVRTTACNHLDWIVLHLNKAIHCWNDVSWLMVRCRFRLGILFLRSFAGLPLLLSSRLTLRWWVSCEESLAIEYNICWSWRLKIWRARDKLDLDWSSVGCLWRLRCVLFFSSFLGACIDLHDTLLMLSFRLDVLLNLMFVNHSIDRGSIVVD